MIAVGSASRILLEEALQAIAHQAFGVGLLERVCEARGVRTATEFQLRFHAQQIRLELECSSGKLRPVAFERAHGAARIRCDLQASLITAMSLLAGR